MKVKVIRQFLNGAQLAREGEVIEVGEGRARELERNNLVVPELGAGMARRAARVGAADPTPSPPSGGPTGEEEQPSSSRRGRPPRTRLSDSERDGSDF